MVTSILVALAACGPPSVRDAPSRDATLVIAAPADVGSLLSVVAHSAFDAQVIQALSYPTLEADFDCGLQMHPALAESWAWSEDGRALSMHLRDDITFADGHPVTAEDIALTYALVADPVVASPRTSYTARMEACCRPQVVGSHELEWRFTEVYDRTTQLAQVSGLAVLPAHVLGDVDRSALRAHLAAREPLGSGPWRLAHRDPGERLVLEPSEAFTGPAAYRPRLDRVVFRVIPDYATRLLELKAGDVDLVTGVAVPDAEALALEHPELRLARRGWRTMDYVGWNLARPLFGDLRVRQALALAADVDGLVARLLTTASGEVLGRRAVGTVTPALCDAHAGDIAPLPYDPARARELLAEAGWEDSDGDGVLDRDGERLSFTLTTNSGNARRADSAVLLQAQWAEVGVEVHIAKLEGRAFDEALRSRDFDAALAGWAGSLLLDPSNVWRCEEVDGPRPFNFVSYCSQEADALVEQALRTPDPAAAAPLWREWQQVVYADQPYLFLFWMDEVVAVHRRFEGTRIDLLSPYGDLHAWSVPAGP